MAHDVFISYSHTDKTVADAVCAKLEEAKIRCWIAPRDILPGKRWGSSIIDAINKSRVVILILTAKSNTSDQVLNEIERAVGKGIPILPIRTEDVTPAEDLELFIMNRHWLDAITPPFEQHLDRLATTVEALLELRPRLAPEVTAVEPEPAAVEPAEEFLESVKEEEPMVPPAVLIPPVVKREPILIPPITDHSKDETDIKKPGPKRTAVVLTAVLLGGIFIVVCLGAAFMGLLHPDPVKAMVGRWHGAVYESSGKLDTSENVTIDLKDDKTWAATDDSNGTWSLEDKKVTLNLTMERGKAVEKQDNKPAVFDVAEDGKTATSDSTQGTYKGDTGKVVLTKEVQ